MSRRSFGMSSDGDGSTFEIYLAWTDRTLMVAADQTALQVLLGAGIAITLGCQTGGCGECAIPYIEGDLIHKDSCLTANDRQKYFCPCVSRARTRLVIAE
jgi:ferredoxin